MRHQIFANPARTRLLSIVCVAVMVATGCGGDDTAEEAEAPSTTMATTTTNPIGTPPPIKFTPIMKFDNPTALVQRFDDAEAMYIAEKAGRIRVLRGGAVGATPVLDISSETSTDGERGLLGITFAPNSQLFYVYFTDKNGSIRITEFQLGAGDVVDMRTRRDLLTVAHPRSNHNGGQLAFGPDNYLYIGTGDGGGSGDPDKAAQDLTNYLGKVLRINPVANGTLPYTVPYDNPFTKRPGAKTEIWAYGLRNPWRFSFDKTNGDLWIADVGQNKYEEINFVAKDPKGGQNYGWPLREGNHQFGGDRPTGAIDPVYEYDHSDGACSVTGGFVYRGKAIEGLQGRYLFGDYCNGALSALTQKGDKWSVDRLTLIPSGKAAFPNLQSFGQDRNGELYLLSGDGSISRLDAA